LVSQKAIQFADGKRMAQLLGSLEFFEVSSAKNIDIEQPF